MAVKAVQVSLDRDLLERIDRDPETKERGRSAFLRSAAQLYLAAKKKRRIDLQIRKAYQGGADAILEEIEDLMRTQAWPEP
jgi:metal-responsive CopG/Arc/MetJ family transcriptional regulator